MLLATSSSSTAETVRPGGEGWRGRRGVARAGEGWQGVARGGAGEVASVS